jgi:F-type H+-transporting ATPase subunit b
MLLFAGLSLLAARTSGQAAETPADNHLSESEQAQDNSALMKWKIVNFAIFAGLLGFAIVKTAPAFFNARSADIQKAIKDATGLKLDADLRYSEVDRKMANLAGEVDKIRAEAKVEMQREHDRMIKESEQELERIHKNLAAEIEALRAEGTLQVRRHTTHLALDLAERRLRDRFSAANSEDVVQDFIKLVDRSKN